MKIDEERPIKQPKIVRSAGNLLLPYSKTSQSVVYDGFVVDERPRISMDR